MEPPLYRLGQTGILVTPIGLGCRQFAGGRGLVGSFWKPIDQKQIDAIVRAAREGGINWFDTAEAYGNGVSEAALSSALEHAGADRETIVATKWQPILRFAGSIAKTFPDRERHLAPYRVTLHQIHNALSFSSIEKQMNAMADLVEARSIQAVGVSNFSASRMRTAHDVLARRGVPLASNQVKYSLLDRTIETNGILETASELGVSVIAYSPLEQGILTGRFHDDPQERERLSGPRRFLKVFRSSGLERSRPLIEALKRVGEAHHASPAQVALAWTTRRHGSTVVAIPGASSVSHAESNARSMAVELDPDEPDEIDEVSARVAG
ncbi:MAG: aldo/keto reductase [Spirochaetota bacterium]